MTKRERRILDIDVEFCPDAPFTDREKEILSELAKGYSIAETAKNLGIAPRTVKSHIYGGDVGSGIDYALGNKNRVREDKGYLLDAIRHGHMGIRNKPKG